MADHDQPQFWPQFKNLIRTTVFILSSTFLTIHPALADLTIPPSTTLDINTGTLTVTGNITNSGTLATSTGTINLDGSWTNHTNFLSGTGTVNFTGNVGVNTVYSTNVGIGTFYNFNQNGAHTLQIDTFNIDIDGDFAYSLGTFDPNTYDLNVGGDFSNVGTGTFSPSTSIVTLDSAAGVDQALNGINYFYDLTRTVTTTSELTFDDTGRNQVSHLLTLRGAVGQQMNIRSDNAPTRGRLILHSTTGAMSLAYLNVQYNDASGGLLLNAGTTSTDEAPGGTNINWFFGATGATWDGSDDTDWDNPFNWVGGFVPNDDDDVTIPVAVPRFPILSSNVTTDDLTINDGANMRLAGFDLTVDGVFSNGNTVGNDTSTVFLYGTETITFNGAGGMDEDSGTFSYEGDGAGAAVRTIFDFGAIDYWNLTINDADGAADDNTFRTTDALNVDGDLTVTGGHFDSSTGTDDLDLDGNIIINGAAGQLIATNSTIDLEGNVTITAGNFTAPGSSDTFNINGDWSNSAGAGGFTHSSGTVTFDDGPDQFIDGDTTWWSFTKVATSAQTLTFDESDTQTIGGTLTLTGSGGAPNQLSLVSDDPGVTRWNITLSPGGIQDITNVLVVNSDASGGLTLFARGSSTLDVTAPIYLNWLLSGDFVWDGDIDEDWDIPGNWDVGTVPQAADNAQIALVANQPELSSNVGINDLTMDDNTTLELFNFNLAVGGTLDNGSPGNPGTIILYGLDTQTMTFGTMDTTDGIIRYIGDGDAAADTFTLKDLSAGGADYASVEIATTDANDTFILGATLDANDDLTITSGTLDVTAAGCGGASCDISVGGDWSNSGTFTARTGLVTLDGSGQAINGSTTFYGLSKVSAGADTLTFQDGIANRTNVTNNLTLQGGGGGDLALVSANPGNEWFIELATGVGATQSITAVDVTDSDADPDNDSSGITLVARGGTSSLNGIIDNWLLGSATITWTGFTDTDFDTPSNWDLGLVPIVGDTAIIPDVTNDPIADAAISVTNLTTNAGAELDLDGNDLTVATTLSHEGTIFLHGDETVTVTMDTDSGTFHYQGIRDGVVDTHTLLTDYYNLVLNDDNSGGAVDVFQTAADLNVFGNLNVTGGTLDMLTNTNDLDNDGNLTIDGGTFNAGSTSIDLEGTFSISSGSFTAPGAADTFTVGGSWSNTGGTFAHNSGDVTFDTAAAMTFTGDTTFFDLTGAVGGKTYTFTAGSTQTVEDDFGINGTNALDSTVQSSVAGSKWFISIPNGSHGVVYLNVQDSSAIPDPGANVINCLNCNDNGNNNVNWVFRNLSVTVPRDGAIVGRTPVIIGEGIPSSIVSIEDSTGTIVATASVGTNGRFRVDTGEDEEALGNVAKFLLDIGVGETLTPYWMGSPGEFVTFDVDPPNSQEPTITSPADGVRVHGATFDIEGTDGNANELVEVEVNDVAGILPLTQVGLGTSSPTGTFSLTTTVDVVKDRNEVSVVVDGISSPIFTYIFTDPFGVVFDSSTNIPLEAARVSIYRESDDVLAVVGVDLDPGDVNPVITGTDGFYAFLTANGNYYIVVDQVFGYDYPSELDTFPPDRSIVTGSKGETFTVNNLIIEMDHPMDGTPTLMRVEKTANKTEAYIGEIITYTVTMESLAPKNTIFEVQFADKVPPGFKFLDDRVLLDGLPLAAPVEQRPLVFSVGNFTPGQKKTIKYQLVVGAGVTVGNYENVAYTRFSSGVRISNTSTVTVKIPHDPLFDLGTVIGKVFYDWNDNGIQDEPEYVEMDQELIIEKPVPFVTIAMEDGTVITTDKDGQYSVPGLIPGRHLLRVDERTLPEGSYFTTDKAKIVDVTPGSINKVNFGINIDNQHVIGKDAEYFSENVQIIQERDKPTPKLNVDLFNPELFIYNGTLVERAEFRNFSNYLPFIDSWHLEIYDKDTKRLVNSFEGTRYNIHDPIFWDGRDSNGVFLRTDRNYSYALKVRDGKGGLDVTEEKDLPVREMTTEEVEEFNEEKKEEEASVRYKLYRKWLIDEGNKSILDQQTILISGETLRIKRFDNDIRSVRILRNDELFIEMPIFERQGLTAKDVLEGVKIQDQPLEMILPLGDFSIEIIGKDVEAAAEAAEAGVPADGVVLSIADGQDVPSTPVSKYVKPIEVGEDYFMFVAMGDGEAGYTFTRGNTEPVQPDERYQRGFWKNGKLAYYLKGKILGKYLVTSSFDTDREQKELLRQVDPDQYYPIYGDDSSINYDATNTRGPLYLLVEWDKSEALWGNYAIDLNDTEFSQFSRTLYGGKINYESVANTEYGDPRTKFVVFNAQIEERPARNEFLGTGGSLYFLHHKHVVRGSDIIKIEVRDAITGLVNQSKELVSGTDYQISYDEGRILFWKPIAMFIDTESIINNDILDGDPVYVTVDYSYEVQEKIIESTYGARLKQAINDEILLGATYVSETQEEGDYQLSGFDITYKPVEDAEIVAEYSESKSGAVGTFVSTDGGISFTEIVTGDEEAGRAYGIKGDARLFDRVGLQSYYKWIENDFSTPETSSQQGKELANLSLTFDLTPITRLTMSHDYQKLMTGANVQAEVQVGATKTNTTNMRIVHEARRLKLTGEFQRTEVVQKDDGVEGAPDETDTIALQADYVLTDRIDVSLKHQVDVSGDEKSQQTTVGAQARVTDSVTLRGEKTFGLEGAKSSASIGGTVNVTENLELSGDYSVGSDQEGDGTATTTFGATTKVTDKLDLTTAVSVGVDTTGEKTTSVSLGGKAEVIEGTTLDTTVGLAKSSSGELKETVSLAAASTVFDDANISTGFELGADGKFDRASGITLDAEKTLDDGSRTKSSIRIDESNEAQETTSLTLGDYMKIGPQLELAAERAFGLGEDATDSTTTYRLTKEKDGKKYEGEFTRVLADSQDEFSRSNIFGLTGDIDDRWAMSTKYEQGYAQNLDGTLTSREVYTAELGYAYKDPETGRERVTSSTKFELRYDQAATEKEQYVFYHATEGKINDNATVYAKIDISETRDKDTDIIEARHREIILGAAYRPVDFDRLNLISQYTYRENRGPAGQVDAEGVLESAMQVYAVEAIYDIDENWQLAEKFAFRILEERVQDFDFNKTHTWMMINRLNYNVDRNWQVSGEYRLLRQVEAKDLKQGFLVEVTRQISDYAELAMGYNFTDFTDDLTNLDYTTHGPYVRVTGKAFDRTPEERERARQKLIDARISKWAWKMVNDELSKDESPIVEEFNYMYYVARVATDLGKYDEAKEIYRDLIMSGQMMFEEAAVFIREQIAYEQKLLEDYKTAEDYFDKGELERARKLWEKVVEEAQKTVLE